MLISDGRVDFTCARCGANRARNGWDIHIHYRWANQFGKGIRVICRKCDYITDYEDIYSKHLTSTIRFFPKGKHHASV